MSLRVLIFLCTSLWALPVLAGPPVDLATAHRIRHEAFDGSQVMEHLYYLTDVSGPRLTGSPALRAAAQWAAQQLKKWGLSGAGIEPWGPFGRSWSLLRYSAHMTQPVYAPLGGIPKAWSSGTQGPVTAEAIAAPLFTQEEDDDRLDIAKVSARIKDYVGTQRGRLRGRIVLIEPTHDLSLPEKPQSERLDDHRLAEMALAPEPQSAPPVEWPITHLPANPKKRRQLLSTWPLAVAWDYFDRLHHAYEPLNAFLRDEGVVAVLSTDRRGQGGLVFAEGVAAYSAGSPKPPPVVVLPPEEYGRIARLLLHKVPVRLDLDVAVRFPDEVADGLNVIGEIAGGKRKKEVVMLGAHLDSWHAGTGATDNAAGCAVVLEAVRILKTLGVRLDRTVRVALWSGEEQGLLGSRGYVRSHFGDPVTMALKPEHAQLAGYFNVDNGTGRIRGLYLQGNDMVRPVFEGWMAPFKDLGATTLTIRNTGGTDHQPFDALGLPGFQFIQDPLDYGSRTHHSNLDVYDHGQEADLMQAAAVLAWFVYNAANEEKMLPRKPLPRPLPAKK